MNQKVQINPSIAFPPEADGMVGCLPEGFRTSSLVIVDGYSPVETDNAKALVPLVAAVRISVNNIRPLNLATKNQELGSRYACEYRFSSHPFLIPKELSQVNPHRFGERDKYFRKRTLRLIRMNYYDRLSKVFYDQRPLCRLNAS